MADSASYHRTPTRVLFISPRYQGGGAERCARELFHRLPDHGIATTMWVAVPPATPVPGVECVRLPGERFGYPLNWLPTINDWRHRGSIRRLDALRPADFDVVHFHNLHGNWLSIQAASRLCRRVPVVWTLHDEWAVTGGMPYDLTRVLPLEEARRLARAAGMPDRYPFHPGPWASRWRRFLESHIPRPAIAVAPSRWLADLARTAPWFHDVPIEQVPYGLPLLDDSAVAMPRAEARQVWNVPPDRPCILVIAADLTAPYKGTHLAIEVLTTLARRAEERGSSIPSLLLLGRNNEVLADRLPANLPVQRGYADSPAKLAAAYRAADVTLIPSVADNLPYTALESFACETPIAAFAVGGLTELVGDGERGLLVPPFDTARLADVLLTALAAPPFLIHAGNNAHTWVCEQCSITGYVDQIVKLYQTAIYRTPN